MKTAAGKPEKTEGELLDQATSNLLRAIKAKAKAAGGEVDSVDLRKAGYSERFIAKVEEA